MADEICSAEQDPDLPNPDAKAIISNEYRKFRSVIIDETIEKDPDLTISEAEAATTSKSRKCRSVVICKGKIEVIEKDLHYFRSPEDREYDENPTVLNLTKKWWRYVKGLIYASLSSAVFGLLMAIIHFWIVTVPRFIPVIKIIFSMAGGILTLPFTAFLYMFTKHLRKRRSHSSIE